VAVPLQRVSGKEFWELVEERSKEDLEKYGVAWAIQYIVYQTQEERAAMLRNKREDTECSEETEYWQQGFGDMSMSEEAPEWLTEEHFEQPWIQALVTSIEDVVRWMGRRNHTG
jgi:hypothetical protein